MSRGLAWVTRHDEAVVTVHARGDIDMNAGTLLREVLLDAVAHAGPDGVVVDLAVTFIDSVALAALVAGYKAARTADLPFAVAAASPAVIRLLAMTGLDRVWRFTPDGPTTAPCGPGSGLTPDR